MTAKLKLACLAGALFAAASTPAFAGARVDAIKARGELICGVNTGLGGFSIADSTGKWVGLDVDVCRAVAAALLGDGNKVKFVPLNTQQRFTALQSGEVDMLSRNTTWTLTRDTQLGLNFAATTYYDGQGFMVPKNAQREERQGAGRRQRLRAARHHDRAQPRRLLPCQQHAVQAGRHREHRRGQRGLLRRPLRRADHRRIGSGVGPQERRQDPRRLRHPARDHLQGAARAGGARRATTSGPTSSSGPCSRCSRPRSTASRRPTSKRWPRPPPTRTSSASSAPRRAWARPSASMRTGSSRPSRSVGNYGEIWTRNIEPLGLPRGVNNLWNKGGLMYAPPIR